jgi:hypothetical protein
LEEDRKRQTLGMMFSLGANLDLIGFLWDL